MEMKKEPSARLLEIKRYAVHDGDGIRTTVFLKGCPLACLWCHNPEGISASPELAFLPSKCIGCGRCSEVCPAGAVEIVRDGQNQATLRHDKSLCISCGKCAGSCLGEALIFYGREVTPSQILPLLLRDKSFFDVSGGGVTLSGGECLLYKDFCLLLLKMLRENGINTAVDTCGYVPESTFRAVLPYVSTFLYDVKAVTESLHIKCTSKPNRLILENLRFLAPLQVGLEIRIPYIPTLTALDFPNIVAFLSEISKLRPNGFPLRARVLPYHNFSGSKYTSLGKENTQPSVSPPSKEEIKEAEKALSSAGIDVITN